MNIPKIFLVPILGVGVLAIDSCHKNRQADKEKLETEQRQKAWEEMGQWQEYRNKLQHRLRSEVRELKHFNEVIPRLSSFDKNKNQILDPEEIDLFIKAVINKGDGEYTKERLEELKKVEGLIEKHGWLCYNGEYRKYGSFWVCEQPYYDPLQRTHELLYVPYNVSTTEINIGYKVKEYVDILNR